MVFLNEAAQTVKPLLRLGNSGRLFLLLNVNRRAPISATLSELRQAIEHQYGKLDARVGTDVNVFCVVPSGDPASLSWFARTMTTVLSKEPLIAIRLFCFSVLPEAPDAVAAWHEACAELLAVGPVPAGIICLLSATFRGIRLDRLRSYPVLASLIEVCALTYKREISQGSKCWARDARPHGMFACGLEEYFLPGVDGIGDRLVDMALWANFGPALSTNVSTRCLANERSFSTDSIEYWLVKAGRCSADLDTAAGVLLEIASRDPHHERLLNDLAVDLRRALANQNTPHLEPPRHAFAEIFMASQDSVIRQAAASAAESLLEVFPLPVHPFLMARHQSESKSLIMKARKEASLRVLSDVRARFYDWAIIDHHRKWIPANSSDKTTSAAVARAFGWSSLSSRPRISFHLDPTTVRDIRQELLEAPDTIRILYTVPIPPIPNN